MSDRIVEISFRTDSSGERFAMWRMKGGRSLAWRVLFPGVEYAERCIASGTIKLAGIGVFSAVRAQEQAA